MTGVVGNHQRVPGKSDVSLDDAVSSGLILSVYPSLLLVLLSFIGHGLSNRCRAFLFPVILFYSVKMFHRL